MQTLVDLLSKVSPLLRLQDVADKSQRAYPGRTKLHIPGAGPLTLPTDPKGMTVVLGGQLAIPGLTSDEFLAAQMQLLKLPGMAFPLPQPSNEDLVTLGLNPESFRNEKPYRVGLGAALKMDFGVQYGVAEAILLEHGIRMGSNSLIDFDSIWTSDLETAEDRIYASLCATNVSLVQAAPEPGAAPWKTIVVLLGGMADVTQLPEDWKRRLSFAAGLRRVKLDIQLNPETARMRVIHDLRTQPPDALLIWEDWVSNPDIYIRPYVAARKGGVAALLGSRSRKMSFEETAQELLMHIREIAPLSLPDSDLTAASKKKISWPEARQSILDACGSHLKLTEKAHRMLVGNPYHDPERMSYFFLQLGKLALEYYRNSGAVGGRLADVAQNSYGIEIALFDNKIEGRIVEFEGQKLETGPHVKVDDFKSPDRCGRIYFSLDSNNHCFVVDHIGLHDYLE